jgi:hypothetical protein
LISFLKKESSPNIFRRLRMKLSMSKREPKLLISDMLESCNKILQYTNNMDFEALLQ